MHRAPTMAINGENMKYNPDIHHRRSIRLKGYDYSQAGLYFITICTQNRLCLFGEIENGEMILNDPGIMIEHQWQELIYCFDNIKLHEFIVMPNHFHGIIEFVGVPLVGTQNVEQPPTMGQPQTGQPQGIAPTVGDVVGAFKSLSTNEYIRGVKNNDWSRFNKKLWQRNYYEHIIRDEKSCYQIWEYVQTNPLKWQDDKYYV
jgi:REP element-mobilizing transposase RayT